MVVAWIGGILHATVQMLFTVYLTFCGPNIINHFICATPVFLPRRSYEQRSLAGYSPWCCKESDMTEQLSMSTGT